MFLDQKLYYTERQPNRLGNLRKDFDGAQNKLEPADCRLIPYWNGLHWLSNETMKQPDLLSVDRTAFLKNDFDTFFLGEQNGVRFFSVDLSGHSEEEALALLPDGKFMDIRLTPVLKRSNQAPLLVYTRGLYLWHSKNLFCGICGEDTKPIDAGHARKCSNCEHVIYPRIDPAVIVLIEYIPEKGEPLCLLGRHRSRHPKMYSTLAGFVETGETLEAAVRREMMEEVALEVSNIRYVASQPWPFPSSIMIGFYAQANSMDVTLDQDEVLEAQWLTATEIRKLVSKDELILSREDSIARYLIQNWVNMNLKSNS
ncbi:MAG: NAD(+) diphosphatase [Bacteroidota bacterium]